MKIEITNEESCTCGFMSWQRLAKELFPKGELHPGEHVVRFEVSEHGIKYYLSPRSE